MGVYIKSMKMPTGCLSCDFCNPIAVAPYCRLLMHSANGATRLSDCPLIELPDGHGRLIDQPQLVKDTLHCETKNAYFNKIVNAPTVIPASELANNSPKLDNSFGEYGADKEEK